MGDESVQSLTDIQRSAAEASGKSGASIGPEDAASTGHTRVRRDAKAPPVGETVGDFNIRIGRDGTWYYRGSPIHRLPLVKLFASVLKRGDDGSFLLVTPVERGEILVEDAPFVAVDMDIKQDAGAASTKLMFRTNLGEIVTAGPDHPIRVEIDPETSEPCPYVRVRDGLDALISRAVFYRLVDIAEERAGPTGVPELTVLSDGVRFSLGSIEDEEGVA